jgi:hypothetical protein
MSGDAVHQYPGDDFRLAGYSVNQKSLRGDTLKVWMPDLLGGALYGSFRRNF